VQPKAPPRPRPRRSEPPSERIAPYIDTTRTVAVVKMVRQRRRRLGERRITTGCSRGAPYDRPGVSEVDVPRGVRRGRVGGPRN
jgi:hypothetical protein